MALLSEYEVFLVVAQLGIIILAARLFGLLARRLGQPMLAGEIVAGLLLGPTVFGRLLPQWRQALFPAEGAPAYVIQGLSWVCVIFLLLVTGLEVDVRASVRHLKRSTFTAVLAIAAPFAALFFVANRWFPAAFYPPGVAPLHGNLLLATSLSVVAIPVIAKVLFDLKIFSSFVGLNIITSGILSDILGWTILAVVISLVDTGTVTPLGLILPLLTIGLYIGASITAGRWLIDRFFNLLGARAEEPTTVLAFLFALALLNGAVAHLLGLHVILGAFVAGMMAGESDRLTPYMRQSIQDFVFGVFAPVFFVLVGMQMRFGGASFWLLIPILLVLSTVFRVAGGFAGALLGRLGRRNAFAVGCGLSTQGSMGIIVALVGIEQHILTEELFSAIVFVCVLTTLLIGPLLKFAVRGIKRPFARYLEPQHIFLGVPGGDKRRVIAEMARLMAERGIVEDEEFIREAIESREESMSTAIGGGVALPHARIGGLDAPIVCLFRLRNPVEFNSPDNRPVQLLFLELTDADDQGMQLFLISQVARFLASEKNRERLLAEEDPDRIHQLLAYDEKL